jgi:hypothetical protein
MPALSAHWWLPGRRAVRTVLTSAERTVPAWALEPHRSVRPVERFAERSERRPAVLKAVAGRKGRRSEARLRLLAGPPREMPRGWPVRARTAMAQREPRRGRPFRAAQQGALESHLEPILVALAASRSAEPTSRLFARPSPGCGHTSGLPLRAVAAHRAQREHRLGQNSSHTAGHRPQSHRLSVRF